MTKSVLAIILIVALTASMGRGEEKLGKGKPYRVREDDRVVVAQKIKGGVLLWREDDAKALTNTWRNADLVFLKLDAVSLAHLNLKNVSEIKRGEPISDESWWRRVGEYRHGNLFTGYRNIPAFELVTDKEEIKKCEDDERRKRVELENVARLAKQREKQLEEQKKRIEEQKDSAEYAKNQLSQISFDVSSYFDIQMAISNLIYSVSVTDKLWTSLKELQSKNDWLGMLKAVSESEGLFNAPEHNTEWDAGLKALKDYPSVKDYPPKGLIKAITDVLKYKEFHAEFLFKYTTKGDHKSGEPIGHRMNCMPRYKYNKMCVGRGARWDVEDPFTADIGDVTEEERMWDYKNATLIVPFKIESG